MADKLGILINTILNAKPEDLQKQLDSVAKKIKINLKPRIDFDENVIAKFKSDVDKLAKNIKLNLRFDVDKQSVKDAEKTVTETAKKITAEKGFNFKQFENITGQVIKLRENLNATVVTLKNYKDALSTPLLQGYRITGLNNVQETEEYLKLTQKLQKGNEFVDLTAYIDKATGSVYKYSHASRNAMIDTLTWSKAIQTAWKRMAQWAAGGTLFFGTLRQIKESIAYIKDVDTELTNLSKVVDLTTSQMIEMKNAAIEMSKTLGQSSVEVLKGFAEFGRYTKDLSEIQELTRTAIMASNVTDMSVTEASKSLISALTQFKLSAKDSINVLDQWNEIQNNFKVTVQIYL